MYVGAIVFLLFVLCINFYGFHQSETTAQLNNTKLHVNNSSTNYNLSSAISVGPGIGTNKKKKSLIALIFLNKTMKNENTAKFSSCKWLRGYKKQFHQCTNRRGFAKVLQDAKQLAVTHCQQQFSFDRWDCTKVQNTMFKRIYRETAFMQALTASALMYSVAKACSDGKLQSCYCMERPRKSNSKWNWVGCSDNTKTARKITRRFLLDGNQLSSDQKNIGRAKLKLEILKNNIDIGLETVKQHKINVCVCHGVSASCSLRTCWKVINRAFSEIADSLKLKYNSAILYKPELLKNSTDTTDDVPELVFLAPSPNFCDATRGRRCKNHNHCATLCCGRGYGTQTVAVDKRCNCKWKDYLDVGCKVCTNNEDHLICK